MKLHEEFKLYENMWEDCDPINEAPDKKVKYAPKPVTKLKLVTHGAAVLGGIVSSILTGDLSHLAHSGFAALIGDILVDIWEAVKYNKVVKPYDKVKQLIAKSPTLRRDIYTLIDRTNVQTAAEACQRIEDYLEENPNALSDNAMTDVNFIYESKGTEVLTEEADVTLDMSMEDFLKALSDMRAEYGDSHLVDANEINAYMADWKANNEDTTK